MKKLATKLTPAIKAWIKEKFGYDYGRYCSGYFLFPKDDNSHLWGTVITDYTEVSEQEFLAEFGKPKVIIQHNVFGQWVDLACQEKFRIKPTPDCSKEIESLQEKAKENGMKAIIKFEKI